MSSLRRCSSFLHRTNWSTRIKSWISLDVSTVKNRWTLPIPLLSTVTCDGCGIRSHIFCLGYDDTSFGQIHLDLISILGWRCHGCRTTNAARIKDLESTCTSLKNEIATLKNINAGISRELKELKDLKAIQPPPASPFRKDEADHTLDVQHSELNSINKGNASWSTVVGNKGNSKPTTIHEVIKAVHSDLIVKKKRETNVVVTGLRPAKDMSDSELFGNLIQKNLKIKTTPLQCKRIGKPCADKIQPLLVVLPSTDVSEEIISKAKMLRKSESVYTSQHVYINRYLTKSESEAVYEMRQAKEGERVKKK